MRSDFHMHTGFSTDTDVNPEDMIKGAINKGLECICITDHYDKDFVNGTDDFTFDPDEYFQYMFNMQEVYKSKIDIRIGIEIGLQMHLNEFYKGFLNKYPFDFVIGSAHFLKGTDPYTKAVFHGVDDQESYKTAFEEMFELVNTIEDFDVLGHMDYIVRYGNHQGKYYSYKLYSDLIDSILSSIINKGKGIELNTAGYKYNLGFAHPHPDILKRYRELGGEIITVGSDGHAPEHVAYEFSKVKDVLETAGFKYYTEYKSRKPKFCEL